jgi:hypothetical protein
MVEKTSTSLIILILSKLLLYFNELIQYLKDKLIRLNLYLARKYGWSLPELWRLLDRRTLSECYQELSVLRDVFNSKDNELCELAVVYWMDLVANLHGGSLLRRHRLELPKIIEMDKESCQRKHFCQPITCIKLFILCRKGWKQLKGMAERAGDSYADVARLLIGESDFPKWCGIELSPSCQKVRATVGLKHSDLSNG